MSFAVKSIREALGSGLASGGMTLSLYLPNGQLKNRIPVVGKAAIIPE